MNALCRMSLVLFSVILPALNSFAQSGIITTYVGPGRPVMGTMAIAQAIDYPASVAFDGTGGFYVSSYAQNRVYRVSSDGKLSLVAGSGNLGFSGDGGQASLAQLNRPHGVIVDSAGNLFIADSGNNRIRKVSGSGIITTVAGTGSSGSSGDGGPATSAQLLFPYGAAVDSAGNLFIADSDNHRIRKVSTSGIITTVAGTGSAGFSGNGGQATSAQLYYPDWIVVDSAGNLYIADSYNSCIRKVSASGIITTVAGTGSSDGYSGDGGPATSAELYWPEGVALDSAGNLFIADSGNSCIRKVSTSGIISTVAGTGSSIGYSGDGGQATSAQFNYPYGVNVDSAGNLFIVDTWNNRIRKVSTSGIITTVAGNGSFGYGGDGGPATSAQINSSYGVAVDSAGNLFIADTYNERIRKVSTSGIIATVAGNGSLGYSGDGGQAAAAELDNPYGVAVDSAGNLFIADTYNHRIRKVSASGIIATVAGNGSSGYGGDNGSATSAQLNYPSSVTIDSAGSLFIADSNNHRIRKVSTSGIITTVAGNGSSGYSGDSGSATSAQLNYPYGVVVDFAGNLFISDGDNHRIRKVSLGIITTVAGNGSYGYSGDSGPATSAQLYYPNGVAVDSAGNLFIADESNNCIRKVSASGIITTVAGNGSYGYSGDGGPATSAQLYYPTGVAVDSAGNLFIADYYNSRIRKVTSASTSDAYFPQVAIGGGWSTSFILSNTGSTVISGNLILTDNEGNPFNVNSSTLGIGYSFPVSIPAGGVMFLTANPLSPNDSAKIGWAKVETYNGSLNGVATYQSVSQGTVQAATGVLSSQSTQFATIPVDEKDSQNLKAAYAIANQSDQVLVVKAALVDSNGLVMDDTVSITLNPGQQIARYFNQDFANRPTFQGSIVMRAQGGGTFIIVGLVQNHEFYTAIPVIPNKAVNMPN
jgi:trimeric autotransporter adhesin